MAVSWPSKLCRPALYEASALTLQMALLRSWMGYVLYLCQTPASVHSTTRLSTKWRLCSSGTSCSISGSRTC